MENFFNLFFFILVLGVNEKIRMKFLVYDLVNGNYLENSIIMCVDFVRKYLLSIFFCLLVY